MLYYTTMKKANQIFWSTLTVLLVAVGTGCNTTPLRQEEPAAEPVFQAADKAVKTRAAGLKKILSRMKYRGTAVSLSAYRSRINPGNEIMKLVTELGFNRLYCSISSETELSNELKELIITAKQAGIPVILSVRQGDFRHRARGNALLRFLLPQYRKLPDLAEDIAAFNDSLPEDAKLAGVMVRFEPHLLTASNGADRIPGLHYIWSDQTFGPGLDNDKLVELSIELLQKMKKNLKGLPLMIELPDLYPLWAAEKKLTKGRVADFAGFDGVMLQCTGNRPREILQKISGKFTGVKNMQAVIPIAGHTSVRSGALRRRDWNDLLRATGYVVNSLRKLNCSGIVLRPLSELGFMILEQD